MELCLATLMADGVALADVLTRTSQHLRASRPSRVEGWSMTESGKIQKRVLREQFGWVDAGLIGKTG